jgi:hypothetical protein
LKNETVSEPESNQLSLTFQQERQEKSENDAHMSELVGFDFFFGIELRLLWEHLHRRTALLQDKRSEHG